MSARAWPSYSPYEESADDGSDRPSWRRFALLGFLALAALLHLALFENPWVKNLTWLMPAQPERIEVQTVDPKKLDAIRKKWARERSLLLSKNQPRSESPPEDARYFSDRDIRVEKEQRARQGEVLPKPGANAPKSGANAAKPKTSLPSLGSLGVPLSFNARNHSDAESEPKLSSESRENPGAEQALLDHSLPEGGENLLNARESVYYSFYARLIEEVGPLWQSKVNDLARSGLSVSAGEFSTLVDVVLDADGNLVNVRLERASGIPAFDRAVDDSWRKVSRFPNPPKGLLSRDGYVHTGWNFTVSVGSGIGLQFLPPERSY